MGRHPPHGGQQLPPGTAGVVAVPLHVGGGLVHSKPKGSANPDGTLMPLGLAVPGTYMWKYSVSSMIFPIQFCRGIMVMFQNNVCGELLLFLFNRTQDIIKYIVKKEIVLPGLWPPVPACPLLCGRCSHLLPGRVPFAHLFPSLEAGNGMRTLPPRFDSFLGLSGAFAQYLSISFLLFKFPHSDM